VPSDLKLKSVESLSLPGEFGRWIKACERWLSVEELYRCYHWKEEL